jgi:hypothetical protein
MTQLCHPKAYHYTISAFVNVSSRPENDMSAFEVRLQLEKAHTLIAGIAIGRISQE